MGDVDFFQLLYSVDWHQNYNWHNKTCLKLHLFWLFCVQCLCQSWQLEKHASHFGKKCYFQFSKMQNSQIYQNNQNEHCKNNFWFDPTPNMPPYLYFYLSTERGIKRGKCFFYLQPKCPVLDASVLCPSIIDNAGIRRQVKAFSDVWQ